MREKKKHDDDNKKEGLMERGERERERVREKSLSLERGNICFVFMVPQIK